MLKTLLRTSCINGRSVPRKQISGCILSRNVNLSWYAANNQQQRLLRQFSLPLESHISLQYDDVKIQYYLFKLVRNFHASIKWNNKYIVNYAKERTTKCKKCKTKIETGDLRVGKVVTNPLSKGAGDMKLWYHPRCMVETFKLTTTMIEKMEGFGDLELEAKDNITKLINGTSLECTYSNKIIKFCQKHEILLANIHDIVKSLFRTFFIKVNIETDFSYNIGT